jgi:hypothetical protein
MAVSFSISTTRPWNLSAVERAQWGPGLARVVLENRMALEFKHRDHADAQRNIQKLNEKSYLK